jgi:hypothetical protein
MPRKPRPACPVKYEAYLTGVGGKLHIKSSSSTIYTIIVICVLCQVRGILLAFNIRFW